jgi:hypothetical protein
MYTTETKMRMKNGSIKKLIIWPSKCRAFRHFKAQERLRYTPPDLTSNNSTFCPHSVFTCFVWISEQTAIISLYNINWLVFITETESVYCTVRTGALSENSGFCHSVGKIFALLDCYPDLVGTSYPYFSAACQSHLQRSSSPIGPPECLIKASLQKCTCLAAQHRVMTVVNMWTCLLWHCYFSEELRGIPRANNAKDVDWTKVATSIRIEASTKPSPIKIPVSELLKQVRPLKQKADTTAVLNVVDTHGMFFVFFKVIIIWVISYNACSFPLINIELSWWWPITIHTTIQVISYNACSFPLINIELSWWWPITTDTTIQVISYNACSFPLINIQLSWWWPITTDTTIQIISYNACSFPLINIQLSRWWLITIDTTIQVISYNACSFPPINIQLSWWWPITIDTTIQIFNLCFIKDFTIDFV